MRLRAHFKSAAPPPRATAPGSRSGEGCAPGDATHRGGRCMWCAERGGERRACLRRCGRGRRRLDGPLVDGAGAEEVRAAARHFLCVGASLPGADADGVHDGVHEDLAVAVLPRVRRHRDLLHDEVHLLPHGDDLQLGLLHHLVALELVPAVPFHLAALSADAVRLGDGHALDAAVHQRVDHELQPPRADDGLHPEELALGGAAQIDGDVLQLVVGGLRQRYDGAVHREAAHVPGRVPRPVHLRRADGRRLGPAPAARLTARRAARRHTGLA
mmetsp:Transcript_23755/g.61713  ORF Transcript_23755/g.61713 Transcript_23755/m.61713 type:complete len:272 (+) Transcript_23755:59-874(+)